MVDLVDLQFSRLSPFYLRLVFEYVCALLLVELVDLTFLNLSLFLPRQFLSLFNMCMVAFASWLGWLAILEALANLAKSSFRICMCAFSGWLDIIDSLAIFSKTSFINFQYVYGRFCWLIWLTCYFQGSCNFCQGKFYHFSICVWSLFLVGLVDSRFS